MGRSLPGSNDPTYVGEEACRQYHADEAGAWKHSDHAIELPGGRLQALSIAWDSRPKAEGRQRWFPLYPNERIDHRDPLHCTSMQQNWNFMCAECHSTDVRRRTLLLGAKKRT